MTETFSKIDQIIKIDLSTNKVTKTLFHDPPRNQLAYQIQWTAWDVSNVETMRNLFYKSTYSNSLQTWNVLNIIDLYDFWPNYIQHKWFPKWKWPKNTKGRDSYF